jgi:hypothetical protein
MRIAIQNLSAEYLVETLGISELDVRDLAEKFGSMSDTTKCCATGTCDNYIASDMEAPLIPAERDRRDALAFAQKLGFLF